ncbi:hypothetical protein [Blastococcus deserti]|uniref:Uncharacterized protein n=1 Tax=Blastococcus deserti TaxID=2259033 RepID=A0ABW4X5S8_9ACTN
MISTTPTMAPADLLGRGGFHVRSASGAGFCSGYAEPAAAHTAAPIAPVQGTGLPTGSTADRVRLVTRQSIGDVVVTTTFENTGTTLGIHSSRRPQS